MTGAHAAAWEGRTTERERDLRRITPLLGAFSEPQRDLFLLALLGLAGLARRRTDLDDHRLALALEALRKTVETRTRGVIYEHPAEDVRAQALVSEVGALFEAQAATGRATAPSDADLLPVLKGLEATLAAASEPTEPRAFLAMAARLTAGLTLAPADEAPRILTP